MQSTFYKNSTVKFYFHSSDIAELSRSDIVNQLCLIEWSDHWVSRCRRGVLPSISKYEVSDSKIFANLLFIFRIQTRAIKFVPLFNDILNLVTRLHCISWTKNEHWIRCKCIFKDKSFFNSSRPYLNRMTLTLSKSNYNHYFSKIEELEFESPLASLKNKLTLE